MEELEKEAIETPAEQPQTPDPAPAPEPKPDETVELLKKILEQNEKQTKQLKRVRGLLRLCLICLLIGILIGGFVAYKLVPPALTLLDSVTTQVNAFDMKAVNGLVGDATTAVAGLQTTINNINGIDFGSLNDAIGSLKNIADSFDVEKLNGTIATLNESVTSFAQMVENMKGFKLFG